MRLRCYPIDEPEEKVETPWRETHADTDYAVQFKLDGLKAGISYGVELEARPIGNKAIQVPSKALSRRPMHRNGGPLRFCVTTCHDFLRRDDGLEGHLIYQPMQLMHPDFGACRRHRILRQAQTMGLDGGAHALQVGETFPCRAIEPFIRSIRPTSSRMIMILSKTIVGPGRSMARSPSRRVSIFSIRSNFPPAIQDITPSDGAGCGDLVAGRQRLSEFQSNGRWPGKIDSRKYQKAWLQSSLRASSATFKLVFTPTPVVGPDRPIRKTIMPMKCFLMRARSSGLCFPLWMVRILFCGDRHVAVCLGRSDDRVVGIWLRTRKCQTPVGMEGRRSKAPAPISARGRWVS